VVLVAVAVGISGCFLTIAINAGLAAQMVDTAIETGLGHVQIHAAGFAADPEVRIVLAEDGSVEMAALAATPGVRASARRVLGEGLLSSTHASVGVRVVAVEPDNEPKVSNFASSVVAGEWFGKGSARVVVGRDLAEQLRVGLGSKVVLSVQDVGGDLTGNAFRVAGLMQTSSREVNQRTVLMHLDQAQTLFDIGRGISEIVLVADARRDVVSVRTQLTEVLGERVEVRSWDQLEPLLVYLVDVMDQMAWVIYAGVFIAMAFGIANVLLMSVYERTREIGVMMAMGMRARRVVTSVVIESMFVTALGLAVGMGVGWIGVLMLSDGIPLGAFGAGLDEFGIQPQIVPVLRANDIAAPVLMALVAALLASAWPAIRVSGLRPSEALRRV
jgi:putative ABC transport system permease protein